VLHILTVHHHDPSWIEIQTRYLRKHLSVPYTTWTSLEGIDPSYGAHFDHVIDQQGGHPGKLNNLAVEASVGAEPSDLLMFLDGDAFPVADPMPLIREGLAKAPLVAVRRAENFDHQPHPCFCVTTVETWRKLPGDWAIAHTLTRPDGRRESDTGGNLLRILELTGTPWVEVLRTNPIRNDPLYFALYGDVIYHHGSGFRTGGAARAVYGTRPKPLFRKARSPILRQLLRQIDGLRLSVWRIRNRRPQILEARRLSEKIQRDEPGWLDEIKSDSTVHPAPVDGVQEGQQPSLTARAVPGVRCKR
jgi:hypothetical protein